MDLRIPCSLNGGRTGHGVGQATPQVTTAAGASRMCVGLYATIAA